MQPSQLVVIGGKPSGRESALCAVRHGMDVTLVTQRLDSHGRLEPSAIRFLAREAERIMQAWSPEGPCPGPMYAPALRETLIGALEISARDYAASIKSLNAIGVRVVEGFARLIGPDAVSVDRRGGGTEELVCTSIILAVGAEAFGISDDRIPGVLTPSSMLHLREIPESLIILGSTSLALEMAYFLSSYGISITLAGACSPALSFLDSDLTGRVLEIAEGNGICILPDVTAVLGTSDGGIDILLSDDTHIDADCVLSCGEGNRRTDGLGLEVPGVLTGPDGEVLVDESMRTNIPQIFAVGSVTGCRFPNVAFEEARIAASAAAGENVLIRYDTIPQSVWFEPELGAVGFTEKSSKEKGLHAVVSTARLATGVEPERWAKLVVEASTGRLIGMHLLGDGAVEASQLAALAMHANVTVDDLADLPCVGGTMSEFIAHMAAQIGQYQPEIARPIVDSP